MYEFAVIIVGATRAWPRTASAPGGACRCPCPGALLTGYAAAWLSGEIEESWAFVLFDAFQALVAAARIAALAAAVSRGAGSAHDPLIRWEEGYAHDPPLSWCWRAPWASSPTKPRPHGTRGTLRTSSPSPTAPSSRRARSPASGCCAATRRAVSAATGRSRTCGASNAGPTTRRRSLPAGTGSTSRAIWRGTRSHCLPAPASCSSSRSRTYRCSIAACDTGVFWSPIPWNFEDIDGCTMAVRGRIELSPTSARLCCVVEPVAVVAACRWRPRPLLACAVALCAAPRRLHGRRPGLRDEYVGRGLLRAFCAVVPDRRGVRPHERRLRDGGGRPHRRLPRPGCGRGPRERPGRVVAVVVGATGAPGTRWDVPESIASILAPTWRSSPALPTRSTPLGDRHGWPRDQADRDGGPTGWGNWRPVAPARRPVLRPGGVRRRPVGERYLDRDGLRTSVGPDHRHLDLFAMTTEELVRTTCAADDGGRTWGGWYTRNTAGLA